MISKLDRYVLREMLIPFLLAVALFVIYILLNLLVLLSDFMLERNVSWTDLLRVLAYRLPELIVLGLPVAVLFAVFLAFGRLSHDRELVALQAGGTSLRRVIVPVLGFGLFISVVTFALNDRVTPWASHQYQTLLRQLVARGAAPQIQDNTIFKDASGRFFYVRRYDRDTRVMQDVLVFDPQGRTYLSELSGPYPQIISAKSARWDGVNWVLSDGVAHVFAQGGELSYQARFETLSIKVGDTLENLFVEQRQPREMSLGELNSRIQTFRTSGQPVVDLVVEFQSKLAIPLGALVFALFAAPLSLSFGFRGRAAGIVVSVLLTGMFQGVLFYAQILSRRGLISPYWGPWLPNLTFGLLGVVLILNVDRISRLEWGRLFRRASGFLLAALLGVSAYAAEGDLPLDVQAQAIEISQQGDGLTAQGDVRARYGERLIQAQELRLVRLGPARWRLEASGEVKLSDPAFSGTADALDLVLQRDGAALQPLQLTLKAFDLRTQGGLGALRLRAQNGVLSFRDTLERVVLSGEVRVGPGTYELRAQMVTLDLVDEGRWRLLAERDVVFTGSDQEVKAASLQLQMGVSSDSVRLERVVFNDFNGRGTFVNAQQETHALRYAGRTARFVFERNKLTRMDLERTQFTTCTCAASIAEASYALSGKRVTLWPDSWILGQEITLSASGVPLFWVPVFFAPLKEFETNPLFPELGRDAARGLYARWRLPALLDPRNRGTFLLDYYSRFNEVGMGLDWQYALEVQSQSGRFYAYRISSGPNEVLDLSWSHRLSLAALGTLVGSVSRRDVPAGSVFPARLAYDLSLDGKTSRWQWLARASRQQAAQANDTTQTPAFRVLERLPELSLGYGGVLGDTALRYSTNVGWGRFREQRGEGVPFVQHERLNAALNLVLPPRVVQSASLTLSGDAALRYGRYDTSQRTSLATQLQARWQPTPAFEAGAHYRFQAVQGRSPFAFDALSAADRLGLQAQVKALGGVSTLSTAYAFGERRFESLSLTLSKQLGEHSVQLSALSLPNRLTLQTLRLQERWSPAWGGLTLKGGYALSARRFEDLIVKFDWEKTLRLGARLDLNAWRVRRTNAEFNVRLGAWSLELRGEVDWQGRRISALQLGLVHHFCHDCWQVGLYLSGQRVWFQVQINAFPLAAVKYSPTDGDLGF